MTDEADKLVQQMEELATTNVAHAPLAELKITVCFARLQVIIAKEQAKSSKILEHYTRSLVRLTWALVWLAVVLLVVTIGLAVFH